MRVIRESDEKKPGYGTFIFSDRFSVFDWGEMPDVIHDKGQALCTMGLYFFDRLEKIGIRHHSLGVMSGVDMLGYESLAQPAGEFMFNLFRVVRPVVKEGRYDYSAYRNLSSNYLIPLEVIYRNTLPEGSSVFRRLEEGLLSPSDVGLAETPRAGQPLERPLVEVSTKLEAMDRYISWDEARELAALSSAEISRIKETTLAVNDLITAEAGKAGLVNEDGKIEFAFDRDRNLVVVDILGTPDECRFTWKGVPVSKEVLRKHYRATPWYRSVESAKRMDAIQWKKLVASPPPQLPAETVDLVSALYKACCNEITGRQWFRVPTLGELVKRI